MGRRLFASTAVAAALGAGAVGGGIMASPSEEPAEPTDQTDEQFVTSDIATANVERRTLTQSKEFNAGVSYGNTFDLPISATGTITKRPDKDAVVEPGQELLRIDNKPVFLAEGVMPMYRELQRTPDVVVKGQKYMRGYDVAHLQQFLLNAGFDADGKMTMTGDFDPNTEKAVKAWQKSVGLAATGRVDRSQLIIHPEAVRIDSELRIGAMFSSLTVSAVDQTLTFNVASRDRSLVAVDGTVDISTSDGTDVTGTVTSLERSIDDQGNSVVKATVRPDQPLPAVTTTAVATATDTLADDVLAVPVRALLAVSQGGFAVELATPGADGGGRLVRVEVGSVADGWAEISGEIEAGTSVVTSQ